MISFTNYHWKAENSIRFPRSASRAFANLANGTCWWRGKCTLR